MSIISPEGKSIEEKKKINTVIEIPLYEDGTTELKFNSKMISLDMMERILSNLQRQILFDLETEVVFQKVIKKLNDMSRIARPSQDFIDKLKK